MQYYLAKLGIAFIRGHRIFRGIFLWGAFSFWLFVSVAVAQYQVDSWTTANGLPQNTVNGILQTRDGYLWLTSFDGLVRFDGLRFTVFNTVNTQGILSNRFTMLFEDATGTLWIANESKGVTRYRNGVFTAYTTGQGLPPSPIHRMRQDADGCILMQAASRVVRFKD